MISISQTNNNICETHIIGQQCKEKFLMLSDNGPLARTGVILAGASYLKGKYHIGRIKSSFTLVLATIAGQGRLTLESNIISLKANDILIAPRNTSYMYELEKSKYWNIVWFHLTNKIGQFKANNEIRIISSQSISTSLMHETQQLMSEIAEKAYLENEARKAKESYISVLLRRLLASQQASSNESENIIRKVWDKIESNLNANWPLAKMATLAGYSSGHFNRLCKQYLGSSAIRYLTDLRLQYGYYLLSSSKLKLKSIAELCGYDNEFAFSVAFKRKFGYPPKTLRDKYQKMI